MALFAARTVYAFNWYNVGAVLPLVGVSLRANAAELGIVLGAFLAGVGLFQIPAGFADLRWGSRRTALGGLTLMGVAGVASAFSVQIYELAALRFLAGVGAAFFFSPALSLISSYFPPGRRGPVIGLYNGGFSLGGAIGLTAGASIGIGYGWPLALAVGGIGLLILVLVNHLVLPADPAFRRNFRANDLWQAAGRVLRSRPIWALSLALTGFWAAVYVATQYIVEYATSTHASWGVQSAATLAALALIMSLPGGPIGGWVGERGYDRRTILGLFGIAIGCLVLAVPFLGLLALAADFVALGLIEGAAFAVLYLIPSYLAETQGEGVALGIALMNSIQVLLGSAIAVTFGYVALLAGFTVAWLYAGGLALALLPLLRWVTPNRATRHRAARTVSV